jgi:hypothetical protein
MITGAALLVIVAVAHAGPACYAPVGAMTLPVAGAAPARANSIVAADGYALLRFGDGDAARESVLRQTGARWCLVATVRGALAADKMVRLGVPARTAQRLWMRMERFRNGTL